MVYFVIKKNVVKEKDVDLLQEQHVKDQKKHFVSGHMEQI